ncbi:MAG: GTP cyclohydrolase II [Thalassobius sp.]|nr:GTP cyclohydrolase II [Thalassovita sp.]
MKRQAEAKIPTDEGHFVMIGYADQPNDYIPHFAFVSDKTDYTKPVYVRIHSECITGDILGSHRCDCGDQLKESMRIVGKEGGVVIYLRQEGRGIGILNKLRAYVLQDQGFDTAEANEKLGLEVDKRDFSVAIEILEDLGIKSVKLLTNNPEKVKAIEASSIDVHERIPLIIEPNEDNLRYLTTKKDVMGHFLDFHNTKHKH